MRDFSSVLVTWGLRSYKGDPGMIGLEPTFDDHLANLVAVFREVRRVLRKDGCLFLNYGDGYVAGQGGRQSSVGEMPKKSIQLSANPHSRPDVDVGSWSDRDATSKTLAPHSYWKPKDLMLMPARVAIALQEDGWWLRSEIIWHKPNPMPESVRDRPTSAHEKLFLLSKSGNPTFWTHQIQNGTRINPRPDYRVWTDIKTQKIKRKNMWQGHSYFYDAEAVRVPSTGNLAGNIPGKSVVASNKGVDSHDQRGTWRRTRTSEEQAALGANLRNVWTISTQGFPGSHFAVFPTKLVEPCIKSGTSEKGVCSECGAPWVRQRATRSYSSPVNMPDGWDTGPGAHGSAHRNGREKGQTHQPTPRQPHPTGWLPSCSCDAPTEPATVLDCFSGAGTTGLVADRLGRDAVLIEISPEYAEMARKRIYDENPLFTDVSIDNQTVVSP